MKLQLPSGKPIQRPPVARRAVFVELGQVLDVVLEHGGEDYRVRPKGTTAMLWAEGSSAIAWWPGRVFELEEREPRSKREREAASTFERWGVWESTAIGNEAMRGASRWERYPAVRIGYRSDKFGRTTDYEHEFGQGVELYRPIRAHGPWVVRGGSLRVTPRGLEG